MATKNIVPRSDGEGQIGTSIKRWLKGVFVNLFVSGYITDGSNMFAVSEVDDILNEYYLLSPEIDLFNPDGV